MKILLASVTAFWLALSPSAACVGRTLVIGSLDDPEGRVVAQVIAILINERTGTTVKIADFQEATQLHRSLAAGEVDIAVENTSQALELLGLGAAGDPSSSYETVKAAYQERLNLVWLPPLGFTGGGGGIAAPVARKDTLQKFPALPRLIAKTEGLLPDDVLAALAGSGEPSHVARGFLRSRKLI